MGGEGRKVRGEWQMSNFRKILRNNNLFDLGFKGYPFTFSNRRLGHQEYKARLDRVIASGSCSIKFPHLNVEHVATMTSDHYLLLVDFMDRCSFNKSKMFRFEPMWLRNENIKHKVQELWHSDLPGKFILQTKLEKCAEGIRKWNHSSFGSVQGHLRRLRGELDSIKKETRNMINIEKEVQIGNELDEWRLREELLWKQRSCIDRLKEGDRNTKYFHARATQRKKINMVTKLQDSNGFWVSDKKDMINLALDHFMVFLRILGEILVFN